MLRKTIVRMMVMMQYDSIGSDILIQAWPFALRREQTLDKVVYQRVGTATLKALNEDKIVEMVESLEEMLIGDDYLERSKAGKRTVIVV